MVPAPKVQLGYRYTFIDVLEQTLGVHVFGNILCKSVGDLGALIGWCARDLEPSSLQADASCSCNM